MDNLRQNMLRLMSESLGLKMGNAEQSSYFSGDMKGGRFQQSLLLQCALGSAVAVISPGEVLCERRNSVLRERERTPHKVNASGRLGIGGQ